MVCAAQQALLLLQLVCRVQGRGFTSTALRALHLNRQSWVQPQNGTLMPLQSTEPAHSFLLSESSKWSYRETTEWQDTYEECGRSSQSPIDIDSGGALTNIEGEERSLSSRVSYRALSDRTLINTGHNVQVNGNFGTLHLPDGDYEALQFNFHFPSEHTINGMHTAGEMHIIHQKSGSTGTDDLAIIAVMLEEEQKLPYDQQGSNEEQLTLLSRLGFGSHLPKAHKEVKIMDQVDLNVFKRELHGGYYHYKGSLTTPPCSQTVHWFVLQEFGAVTPNMVASFTEIYPYPFNNRPVAALNGRTVTYSTPEVPKEYVYTSYYKSGAHLTGIHCVGLAFAWSLLVVHMALP